MSTLPLLFIYFPGLIVTNLFQETLPVPKGGKERTALCPICFHDVPSHFARHLERHHKDVQEVKEILQLQPKNKRRLQMIKNFKKEGVLSHECGEKHGKSSSPTQK